MIKLYIIIILATFALIAIARHEPKPVIYVNGWEKHDLETWRKRGIETAKNRNDKSILKHAQGEELIGALFIIHNWNLTKCE